ncbi:subunit 17 of mediator complex-domain-containing protein [Hyaloscypha sp. PMI_1271]|nr:subunit 17 of mediator complex-domain-containing protein [Hyaloscypha sp. PMI_1271]
MGSLPSDFAISLKARPSSKTNTNLPGLIERINIERGGFQNITEDSLRQEIAEAELGNEDGDENGTSDEEEEEPDRMRELMTSREAMLGQIETAHQSAMFALDFVSLLLSKDTPVQASLSISPYLRELVGMGTLGADKLYAPRTTDVQKQDNKQIAKGWKSQSLNKTVDSILASASRLEKEIELETRYWQQVLAVSNNGWSICRLPNEKHTLGVRFGFSEASPAFKSRSLAALRRNPDGTISLHQGIASSEPQSLRVRIQTGDDQTGSSTSPQPAAEDAPIEALILQARNTIFSEELWQELNREARTMGSYGVQSKDDTLICPLSATKVAVFDLVPLGESSLSGPDDAMAEGIFITLNLLLSYAHRQNQRRRTQPPPPISSQKNIIQPYNLLRAILTRLKHQETTGQLYSLLSPLCRVMETAKLKPLPTFTVTSTPGIPPSQYPQAEQTMLSLIERLETIATFSMSEATTVTISARTSPVRSTFGLTLSPDSPLMSICPPPPQVLTSYPALRDYIYYFTACAIATSISTIPSGLGIDDANVEAEAGHWRQTPHPMTLRMTLPNSATPSKLPSTKQLSISIQPLALRGRAGIRLRAHWEWNGTEQEGTGTSGRKSSFGYPVLMEDVQKALKEDSEAGKKLKRGKGEDVYDWVAWEKESGKDWDDGEGEVFRTLESVVADAGK